MTVVLGLRRRVRVLGHAAGCGRPGANPSGGSAAFGQFGWLAPSATWSVKVAHVTRSALIAAGAFSLSRPVCGTRTIGGDLKAAALVMRLIERRVTLLGLDRIDVEKLEPSGLGLNS